MGALRERMTTKSGETHQRALLYEFFHPQSRRPPTALGRTTWSEVTDVQAQRFGAEHEHAHAGQVFAGQAGDPFAGGRVVEHGS